MKIAIIGLGKMGFQFVKKLSADGFEVIAHDMDQTSLESASQVSNVIIARSREDAVTQFNGEDPIVWLMIPADAVEEELASWLPLLGRNSILIDGGNSDYRKSQTRSQQFANQGVRYLDIGVSGGILGETNGFSLMVGGQQEGYDRVLPVIRSLAEPNGTYSYFGGSGAGHFVKMVHNAIEYGLMESLAEGYHMLKNGPFQGMDLAKVSDIWQHGSIVQSLLNGLVQEILTENPELTNVSGYVAETGETKWLLEVAQQANIGMPAIQSALDVRLKSQNGQVDFSTKLLAALRNKFGGHSENPQ